MTNQGVPIIDPTANVLSLVEAAVKRLNDLREADLKRGDDIRQIEVRCETEVSTLREKLQEAESRRIDALNLAERNRVDARFQDIVANAALIAERTAATATTLQQTMATSAEALRTQAASSNAILTEAIKVLERNQYQGAGAAGQRTEGRQMNQWVIGIVIVIGIFLANYLPRLFTVSKP